MLLMSILNQLAENSGCQQKNKNQANSGTTVSEIKFWAVNY